MRLLKENITFQGKGEEALKKSEGFFKNRNFLSGLKNREKISNIELILADLIKKGITDPKIQAGILAVIGKESGFVVRNPEMDYSGTSSSRIKKVFKKFRNLSDEEVNRIKRNPEEFFNFVYGGKFGNLPSEGFKYRGRGFNGLTFKSNYEDVSKDIGIDLVSNPDRLSDPKIASLALASYYKKSFENGARIGKIQSICGSGDPNKCKDLDEAAKVAYLATAGWGSGFQQVGGEGFKRVMDSIGGFYKMIQEMGVPDPAPAEDFDRDYKVNNILTGNKSEPVKSNMDFIRNFAQYIKDETKKREILNKYTPEED